MTLAVILVKTITSTKFIQGQSVTCAVTTLIVSRFSLFLCFVVLSIFYRPKHDLYEHFFWQLTV